MFWIVGLTALHYNMKVDCYCRSLPLLVMSILLVIQHGSYINGQARTRAETAKTQPETVSLSPQAAVQPSPYGAPGQVQVAEAVSLKAAIKGEVYEDVEFDGDDDGYLNAVPAASCDPLACTEPSHTRIDVHNEIEEPNGMKEPANPEYENVDGYEPLDKTTRTIQAVNVYEQVSPKVI